MTWAEEIKRKDPALARDYAIVGWGQSSDSLRNMVRALKMMRGMNTAEEERRLAAAQRILRKSHRRNPHRRGKKNPQPRWTAESQKEYVLLKKVLKSAIASKEPDRIIREVDHALARFEIIGEPDDWSMWERAKEDAEMATRHRKSWFNPRKRGVTRRMARAVLRARRSSGRRRLKHKLWRRLGHSMRGYKSKRGHFVRRAALMPKRRKKARY